MRAETTPEDIHGMEVAAGILTSRGGMTSHAAVVTRGMGKCCVAGAGDIEVNEKTREMRVKGQTFKEGDWISLDGTTGRVIKGKLEHAAGLARRSGAAEVHGLGRAHPQAWASAPMLTFRAMPSRRALSAPKASAFAAPSTCSSPKIDLPHMRAMILADTEKDRRAALKKAAADAARRFRRRIPRHGWIPGHDPHARPAAARVPAAP